MSVFTYDRFELADDRQSVHLHYRLQLDQEEFAFDEVFDFGVALPDSLEVYRLLRALHLASGTSYYKIMVANEIEHPYSMSTAEAAFWNDVFVNGLGEFLYVNKIDPTRLARFSAQEGADTETSARIALGPGAVLGIGGGKDSIVAGELLKRAGTPLSGFVMATGEAVGQAEAVAHAMGIKIHVIKRTLDPSLLTLQEREGAFKGHIPISVLFALCGCLLAVASVQSYVVVANEASASIPQVVWGNRNVNHQWSKSLQFEKALQTYLHKFVSTDLHYFSAIRPLTSVAVAKIFSHYPAYFRVFTSDNSVFRIDPAKRPNSRWSHDSPKTLSSYLLLAPWLPTAELQKIFGAALLYDASLEPLFLQLLGVAGEHVLDCVGTPDELRSSVQHILEQDEAADAPLIASALAHKIIGPAPVAPRLASYLVVGADHVLPADLAEPLLAAMHKELADITEVPA